LAVGRSPKTQAHNVTGPHLRLMVNVIEEIAHMLRATRIALENIFGYPA